MLSAVVVLPSTSSTNIVTPTLIFTLAALAVAAQFFPYATAVIGPELTQEFRLSMFSLGLVQAAYFVGLLLALWPVIRLMDRFGPRLIVGFLIALSTVGCFAHAAAHDQTMLWVARGLTGIGGAGTAVATAYYLSRRLRPDRQTPMLARLNAVGALGLIIGSIVIAVMVAHFGWRWSFLVIGIAVACQFLVFCIGGRERSGGPPASAAGETVLEVWDGLLEIIIYPGLVRAVVLRAVVIAVTVSLALLCASPMMHKLYNIDVIGRGAVVMMVLLANVVGGTVYVRLIHHMNIRKWLIMYGTLGMIACLVALTIATEPAFAFVAAMLAASGLLSGSSAAVAAQARDVVPAHLGARAATLLASAEYAGSAILLISLGAVLDLAIPAYSIESAFRYTFGIMALLLSAGLIFYAGFHE